MRIDSDEIIALGDSLEAIADQLDTEANATRGDADRTYGFVNPSAEGAYDAVRGDYELVRIALCEQLYELGWFARRAGGCYVATEDRVQDSFQVGP